MAVVPESFHIPSWSATKDYTKPAGRMREDGFVYGSGGKFVAKSGEVYFDPRYS